MIDRKEDIPDDKSTTTGQYMPGTKDIKTALSIWNNIFHAASFLEFWNGVRIQQGYTSQQKNERQELKLYFSI